MNESNKKYESFGGWLLVLFIGQILAIILNIGNLVRQWSDYGSLSSKVQEILNPIMSVFTIQTVLLIICSAFLMKTIKTRSEEALAKLKKIIIGIAIINTLCSVIIQSQLISITGDSFDALELMTPILTCVLWMSYFSKSKRVEFFYSDQIENETIQ